MTAPTTTGIASESQHWYWPDGRPAYEIEAAKGGLRATTLRDARKFGLYPSVTTIIKAAAAPALERWKQQQVLMAALTLPRNAEETEAAYVARIMDDSKDEARRAADAGAAVHGAIECSCRGEEYAYREHVAAFRREIRLRFGDLCDLGFRPEHSFAHPMGFGGKADLHCDGLLLDVKTKDADAIPDAKLYDEHYMQLAAYRVGLGIPTARAGIVFVSRNDPAVALAIEASEAELTQGWAMFSALFEFWCARSGHRPGQQVAA